MKIGISTTLNYDIPLTEMLPLVKAAGFDAVSLGGKREHSNFHLTEGRAQIGRLLDETGLILDSIHAPFKREDGDISALEEEIRTGAVENLKNAVDAANVLRAPIVILHLNARFPGAATPERIEQVRHSMHELVPYAEAKNIRLACENLVRESEHRIFETILAEFTQPHVGFCYDSAHDYISGTNFKTLERYGDRLFTIHIVDDIETRQDDHLLPFEGKIDWQDFSRVFKKTDYKGIFLLEPEMRLSAFKQPAVFLKEALARAKRILEE
jgi:sugar phosphate isomerase/epimerase